MTPTPTDCAIPDGVIIKQGAIAQLGDEVRKLTPGNVLLVSDTGIQSAGIVEKAEAVLTRAGITFSTWLDVEENPTTETVARGVAFATPFQPALIIGLGGGSSMDCAKGINFILTNGGSMKDYWGIDKASHELLPMIAVPTTAGTGSETQSFALISDPDTHIKMACGDKTAAFRTAILDPELTLTQPRSVAVATGIDAISHALESAVTTKRNAESSAYAHQAWTLLSENFPRVLTKPDDIQARQAMQTGAMFAGAAIERSMLGAAHALANPLTAHYGITHGPAVALMLPHVIRFNAPVVNDVYAQLMAVAVESESKPDTAAMDLADFVSHLMTIADLPQSLTAYDIPIADLSTLADDASQQWTAQFNPREININQMKQLYTEAFTNE